MKISTLCSCRATIIRELQSSLTPAECLSLISISIGLLSRKKNKEKGKDKGKVSAEEKFMVDGSIKVGGGGSAKPRAHFVSWNEMFCHAAF